MAGEQKKRLANMEALRILAMMMVVSLHYLGKGGLLGDLEGELSPKNYTAWLLESFSLVSVNVYVLISGFFGVKTKFRMGRVVSLILQVLFYSCMVSGVLILLGRRSLGELTLYEIWEIIFPIQMGQYWFMTTYVLMVLFSPVLNAAANSLKKEQLQTVVVLLLFVISFLKTALPIKLFMQGYGYDITWFMSLYLLAAYIRLYGIPFLEKKNRALICYVLSCLGIYALFMIFRELYFVTGKFRTMIGTSGEYNHLLNLTASMTLLYAFRNWEFGKRETRLSAFVCKISPYSLGVYLLHEQMFVRSAWPARLGADRCDSVLSLLGYWFLAIVVVMACGIMVDYCRNVLFRFVGKLFAGGKIDRAFRKIDERINGLWTV